MVPGRRVKTANTNAKDCSIKRKNRSIKQCKLQEDHSITDYFKINCFERNQTTYDDHKYTTPNKRCSECVAKTEFEENGINTAEDNFLMLDNVKNLTKILSPSTPHRIQLCPDVPEHNLLAGIITSDEIKNNLDRKIKSKLRKIENGNKISNGHKLTEYFPIRRSARKTKRTVLEEKQKNLEQLLRNGIEEGLEVHNFEDKGRGVVAVRSFNRGDFVVEYSGELLDVTSAKKREELYSHDVNTGCYMYYFKYQNQQYWYVINTDGCQLTTMLCSDRPVVKRSGHASWTTLGKSHYVQQNWFTFYKSKKYYETDIKYLLYKTLKNICSRKAHRSVDATAESGRLGRLVNHSRNGNLITRTITVDGLPRLVLIAKEYIGVGEEICYDYGDRSKESLKNHPWLAL